MLNLAHPAGAKPVQVGNSSHAFRAIYLVEAFSGIAGGADGARLRRFGVLSGELALGAGDCAGVALAALRALLNSVWTLHGSSDAADCPRNARVTA
jgi:hypothetical protein